MTIDPARSIPVDNRLAFAILIIMSNTVITEYSRKLSVAGEIADNAWLAGGLDAMEAELATLRRLDADPVIIAELERVYHKQITRVADAGGKYW